MIWYTGEGCAVGVAARKHRNEVQIEVDRTGFQRVQHVRPKQVLAGRRASVAAVHVDYQRPSIKDLSGTSLSNDSVVDFLSQKNRSLAELILAHVSQVLDQFVPSFGQEPRGIRHVASTVPAPAGLQDRYSIELSIKSH